MLEETEIYVRMKGWLHNNHWKIIGGEPPGGTNDIPVIELKNPLYLKKGSKGSKKIDLIAFKQGYFLFLELKPVFSYQDIKKLNEVCGEKKWRISFMKALVERKIHEELNIRPEIEANYVDSDEYYVKAVGFNDTGKLGPHDFVTFLVSENEVRVVFGNKLKNEIRQLFTF
jgi:hypothetical protein